MGLTIRKGEATPSSLMIFFSDAVVADNAANALSATNPANYTVYDPNSSGYLDTPTTLSTLSPVTIAYDAFARAVLIPIPGKTVGGRTTPPFTLDDPVVVTVRNIAIASAPGRDGLGGKKSISLKVNGSKSETEEVTEAVEDAVAYPLLTEQVSFPGGGGAATGMAAPSAAGMPLGQIVGQAITDVLGWKINASDPKGFVGALTQSFTLTDVEGHTEAKWTPRSYAVQTDLSGGITGAQASLYSRAKDALDQSLPLLDGLYPLTPEADPEDVKALRELARSQMSEIVKELGMVGGPSILRVNTYFKILLGTSDPPVPVDADSLTSGTLQSLRDLYGIGFQDNAFSNSIEDEQDITNFRIISDYMTSLLQTWINNRKFFQIDATEAFFGTQLVLISRQLSVIVETVNEVRFALNSVFIGPSERQTLQLKFPDGSGLPSMFLEDVLVEVEDFASTEGPALVQSGGRLSVRNNILPVVDSLDKLVRGARKPKNIGQLPKGYKTIRVQNTLADLSRQLGELIRLTKPVGRDIPPPEGGVFALPATVDFGSVPFNHSLMAAGVGGAPATSGTSSQRVQVVSLVNLGDTRIAKISGSISVAPGAFNPFAITATNQFPSPDTASSLGAGKTASVSVTFTPEVSSGPAKSYSGTLVITDVDSDTELVSVPLLGEGV